MPKLNLSIQDIINKMHIYTSKDSSGKDELVAYMEKPTTLSISLLNYIPIFKLFVKLYNKYYNQKNNIIDQFIIFNDVSLYDSNVGLSNKYIITMIDQINKLTKKENIDLIIKSDEALLNETIKNNINNSMDLEETIKNITDKTYSNNFYVNMQSILNKSDEIKNAYKANINKFNNIIIQNIDNFVKTK